VVFGRDLDRREVEADIGWRTYFPAIVIAASTIILGVYASYSPPLHGQMAVVFAPGTKQIDTINAVTRAGGSFVSPTRFNNVIIVFAPDKYFRRDISQYGGWFTLAAQGLCSPLNSIL